ncbi:hypothetical protein GALL_210170 [mine drainage metagenome]|uniref:Uncharacterized protein n=1 Tax=mine drainage metagenome TaxID=410659 RepID=A0A1J5RLP0_9ZZZZ
MNKYLNALVASTFAAILTACGGGGTTAVTPTGPVTSTLSFPVAQAMATDASAGSSSNFTIAQTGSVSCSGSGNITRAPATTSTTFNITPTNTVSALSAVETITLNWTNCTPSTSVTTATLYYTPTTYVPLGLNSVGVNYGAYLTAPSYPATVMVGGTGIIGTENLYTDSTEVTSNGRIDGSYVVTADTATTAIITVIGKEYDASSVLVFTEQDAYRITATGVVTRISTNVQYANGINVTFTYN